MAEREAALPKLSGDNQAVDSTVLKAILDFNAIDTPETSGPGMEADVRFLSDAFCSGRAMGTAGSAAAASYTYRRLKECGLDPSVSSFTANGKTGRNVIGEYRLDNAVKWVIVMARLDAIGDHSGIRFPAADANASGVAAMIRLAEKAQHDIMCRNLMFVAVDGHYEGMSGASRLWDYLEERGIDREHISMVINLDEIGSDLEPPVEGLRNYLIALGGERYAGKMYKCRRGMMLNLYYDYYGSRNFTDLFYRRASDHKVFLEHGVPCVMFTSGITMNTNRPTDVPSNMNFPLLENRVEFIFRWLKTI